MPADCSPAPDAHYGPAAVAAVERWQTTVGDPVTGSVPLGAIAFLPAAVRIDSTTVSPGQPASPGDIPYEVTTTTRAVSVPLTPSDPTVAIGADGDDHPALGGDHPGAGQRRGTAAAGRGERFVVVVLVLVVLVARRPRPRPFLTVTPDDPAATGTADGEAVQVSLTVQSVQHVLAVPSLGAAGVGRRRLRARGGVAFGTAPPRRRAHRRLRRRRSPGVEDRDSLRGTRVVVAQ